jgi:hypothetical protein
MVSLAVMHHAPDVTDQGVMASGNFGQTGNQAGKHALGVACAGRARQCRKMRSPVTPMPLFKYQYLLGFSRPGAAE